MSTWSDLGQNHADSSSSPINPFDLPESNSGNINSGFGNDLDSPGKFPRFPNSKFGNHRENKNDPFDDDEDEKIVGNILMPSSQMMGQSLQRPVGIQGPFYETHRLLFDLRDVRSTSKDEQISRLGKICDTFRLDAAEHKEPDARESLQQVLPLIDSMHWFVDTDFSNSSRYRQPIDHDIPRSWTGCLQSELMESLELFEE